MVINFKKSGIMKLRIDKRTRDLPYTHIQDFPVVTSYKYLGVTIDDCTSLKLQERITRQKLR